MEMSKKVGIFVTSFVLIAMLTGYLIGYTVDKEETEITHGFEIKEAPIFRENWLDVGTPCMMSDVLEATGAKYCYAKEVKLTTKYMRDYLMIQCVCIK